jgi:hypothetical protein
MAAISTVFAEVWSKEVKVAYQQKAAKFPSRVRMETGINGDTWKFNVLDATASVQTDLPDLGADGSATDVSHSSVTATLAPSFVWNYLRAEDMVLTSVNDSFRRTYVLNAAAAIARNIDEKIVAALDANFTAIPTTTGVLTYDKVLEAIEVMEENEVDQEDWTLFLAPRQARELRDMTQFTSRDFTNTVVNSRSTGRIDTIFGSIDVVLTNRLNASGNFRLCYLVHKQAVGYAVATELQTTLTWLEEKDQWLAKSKESSGAVVIDGNGVVQIQNDES